MVCSIENLSPLQGNSSTVNLGKVDLNLMFNHVEPSHFCQFNNSPNRIGHWADTGTPKIQVNQTQVSE